MAERVAPEYEPKVEGKPLPQRVVAVTEILEQEGGFAEWRLVNEGYEITDYNCVYRRVADSDDDVCNWHLSLLRRLLGSEVRCDQFMSKGAHSCRFVVKEGSSS